MMAFLLTEDVLITVSGTPVAAETSPWLQGKDQGLQRLAGRRETAFRPTLKLTRPVGPRDGGPEATKGAEQLRKGRIWPIQQGNTSHGGQQCY